MNTMNRRGFLSLLGAASVAPLVPMPDLVLPTRTIFLPPRGGWASGNRIFTAMQFYEDALWILDQSAKVIAVSYDGGKTYSPPRIRVGDKITIEGIA